MDAAQIATLAIVAGLGLEKVVQHFNLYDGVKKMHIGCSSCCDFDVDRTRSPPLTPITSPSGAFVTCPSQQTMQQEVDATIAEMVAIASRRGSVGGSH